MESIKAGTDNSPTFGHFTGLKRVGGKNVTTIGNHAFYGCKALEMMRFPKAETIGDIAFHSCTALKTMNIPMATNIGALAFYACTALEILNLPMAASIGHRAFLGTDSKALTVTLGATVPTLGPDMFYYFKTPKNVTVQVPSGAAGYGVSPADTITDNWGNAFRGRGWDGTAYGNGEVNSNITLTIETY